jgi:hypothetical protein
MSIHHFLSKYPTKTVMFIVPSRALTAQQGTTLRDYCSNYVVSKDGEPTPAIVTECCGNELDGWSALDWAKTLGSSNVVVGVIM